MREIKFRAWDKDGKRMIYFGSLKDFGEWIYRWYRPKRYILLEYTGLKDKNGKELYGGDIIKDRTLNGKRMFEVYWEDKTASFWAKLVSTEDNAYRLGHNFAVEIESEIIGNIYSNPELLEEK